MNKINKYKEMFDNYINGQLPDFRKQLKSLSMNERWNFIIYSREIFSDTGIVEYTIRTCVRGDWSIGRL